MNPYASNPSRPSRYSITAVKQFPGEPMSRTYACSFHDCYGARVWLNVMIGNEACVHIGHELVTDSGIRLRSFELQAILDYQLKPDEAKYRLPDDIIAVIAKFRRGTWEAPVHPVIVETFTTTLPELVNKRKLKAHVEPKLRAPDGYVTIGSLCKGTPVQPMNARALLRASNMVKPSYGWAFAPEQVDTIKRLVGL